MAITANLVIGLHSIPDPWSLPLPYLTTPFGKNVSGYRP